FAFLPSSVCRWRMLPSTAWMTVPVRLRPPGSWAPATAGVRDARRARTSGSRQRSNIIVSSFRYWRLAGIAREVFPPALELRPIGPGHLRRVDDQDVLVVALLRRGREIQAARDDGFA